MNILYLILLLGGALCFAAEASGRVTSRFNLLALGLLLWVLVPLIQTIDRVF